MVQPADPGDGRPRGVHYKPKGGALMGRCRIVSPTVFNDENLAELSYEGRWLWLGLHVEADREGRLEDRPVRLRAVLFPYDPQVDVKALLDALEARGYIVRYSVDGAKYIYIPSFFDFQRPHLREAASKIPAPDERQAQGEPKASLGSEEAPRRCPVYGDGDGDGDGDGNVSVSDPVSISGRETDTRGPGRRASRAARSKPDEERIIKQRSRQVLDEHPAETEEYLIGALQSWLQYDGIELRRARAADYLKQAIRSTRAAS